MSAFALVLTLVVLIHSMDLIPCVSQAASLAQCLCILINISILSPRHKQELLSQTSLLALSKAVQTPMVWAKPHQHEDLNYLIGKAKPHQATVRNRA